MTLNPIAVDSQQTSRPIQVWLDEEHRKMLEDLMRQGVRNQSDTVRYALRKAWTELTEAQR